MKLSYLFSTTIIMIIMFTAPLFPYLLSNDDSACCHPAKVTVILCACAYLCVCNSLNAVCGKTSCVCGTHTQEEECVGVTSVQWEEEEEEGDLSTIWAWWWWRLLLLLLNVDHVKDLMLREAWTLVMFCVYLDLLVHVKQRAKAWTHHRITAVQKQKHHTDTTLKTAANDTGFFLYLFLCLFASLRSSLQIICKSLCFYVVFLHLSFTVCITAVILLSHCARLPCSGLSILVLCLF